jgi:hypothetical protein
MKKLIAIAAVAGGLFTASAGAAVLTDTNNTFGNFDRSSGNRTFAIGGGTIADVNILIDFAKCDDPTLTPSSTACIGLNDSFNREIVFRLTSPDGITVNLVNENTYSGQTPGARVQVNFDDAAASAVGGPALQTGTFRPVGSLSSFNGLSALGVWTLFVQDTVGFDPLTFFSATLTVTTVPEPAMLGLMGFGLLLVGFSALRRKQQ